MAMRNGRCSTTVKSKFASHPARLIFSAKPPFSGSPEPCVDQAAVARSLPARPVADGRPSDLPDFRQYKPREISAAVSPGTVALSCFHELIIAIALAIFLDLRVAIGV
jgi:hypothetical protein